VKRRRLSKSEREHHLLCIEHARKYLVTTTSAINDICTSKVWLSKINSMGEDIGAAQRDKWKGVSRRTTPVAGDDGYLLEATHQVVARELQDRDHAPFSQPCKLILELLSALRDIEDSSKLLGMPIRTRGYFHQYVEEAVTPLRCYVFLLYCTYLRIELPPDSSEIQLLDALLTRYPLFSILSRQPAGISDVLLIHNGRDRFRGFDDEPFENRYWYTREIKPSDTLMSLVQLYPNWDRTWEQRIEAIREYNPQLKDIAPDALLLSATPPVTSVKMVPPARQMKGFDDRIASFRDRKEPAGPRKGDGIPDSSNLDEREGTFTWRGVTHKIKSAQLFRLVKCLVSHSPDLVDYPTIHKEAWDRSTISKSTIRGYATTLRKLLRKAKIDDLRVVGRNKQLGLLP
jgi:hypothetical protein